MPTLLENQPMPSLTPRVELSTTGNLRDEQGVINEAMAFLQDLSTDEDFWASRGDCIRDQVRLGLVHQAIINHLDAVHQALERK